ncbi:Short-chain dehydrogenase TIC 32, chloroplastic [Glycine soja]
MEEVTQGINGSGLTAIVTGTTHGIGTETARVLALRGVHVIMAARDVIAAKAVKEAILKEIPTAKVDAMELDLSSMTSVRKFALEYISSGLPLNILINNAGISAFPFTLSKDNIELQFATNHLGHFLLTNLLLDTLKKTASESKKEGRIIIVSSDGHQYTYPEGILFDKINDESSYQKWHAYGQSKLANILHANELTRLLKEDGIDNITANSLHPGAIMDTNIYKPEINGPVPTDLINRLGSFLLKNIQQGAATTCYVALHPQVRGISGEYFSDNNLAKAILSGVVSTLVGFSLKNVQQKKKQKINKTMWWPFSRIGSSGFSSYSTAEEVTHGIDGSGLTAIVTGASSGLGAETARVLALRGVHVIMGVIDMIGAKTIKEAILKEIPIAKVDVMELDLSSMTSIRNFASKFNSSGLSLNILINNAGICAAPFALSKDNIELQFAINYLEHRPIKCQNNLNPLVFLQHNFTGHFLLTNMLLDTMKKAASESKKQGRIINISSIGYRFTYREGIIFDKINDQSSYNNWCAYGQSKLANILHANELARRLKEDGIDITANSVHPGATVSTNIHIHSGLLNGLHKIAWLFGLEKILGYMAKNVQQGASTTCYVALHPQVSGISGKYFEDNNLAEVYSHGRDMNLAKKLWDFSINLTK